MLRRAALHFGHKLLLLHPPVLEPDGDLPLRQVGHCWNLPPLVLGDEFVGGVLFLQFFELELGVRYPLLSASAERRAVVLVRHHICLKADKEKRDNAGGLRTRLRTPGHIHPVIHAHSVSVMFSACGLKDEDSDFMIGADWTSILQHWQATWWMSAVCKQHGHKADLHSIVR